MHYYEFRDKIGTTGEVNIEIGHFSFFRHHIVNIS